jgi:uncharacterized protein (TIGR02147 family)
MTPFDFNQYRDFLLAVCQSPHAKRGIQTALAKSAGCQASYFSQVLKGKVHLTEDQALGVAGYLVLTYLETEYFLLLIRHAKAGTKKLQEFLGQTLAKMKNDQLNLTKRVGADNVALSNEDIGRYASSWIPSVIHILTSSQNFQSVSKIASRLNLSTAVVTDTLFFLRQMGFVIEERGHWRFNKGSLHIPKDSPWSSPLQRGRRFLADKSIQENSQDTLHFSSVFTMDRKDYDELKKMLSNCIEKSHDLIKNSGTEELYCICLDFFTLR